MTLRTPFPPLPITVTVTTPPLYYFIIFIYSNTRNSITRVPGMEDNKNTHPPPKTRRAQVANACMKCRDAKLKVSYTFLFFFFFFLFTNTKHKHYTIQTKRPKKTGNKCGSCHKKFVHLLYSAPPLVPFAIGVSIGNSRACTT